MTGGSFSVGIDIIGKQLQLLKEVFPRASSVAILVNPTNPGHALILDKMKADAKSLGLSLHLLEARAPDEFDKVFAVMAKDHVNALLVVADAMFQANRTRLAELAANNRLPTMYTFREYVDAGGLISYGPNLVSQYRQAAMYVDKVLSAGEGRKIALPFATPSVKRPIDLCVPRRVSASSALRVAVQREAGPRLPEIPFDVWNTGLYIFRPLASRVAQW